MTIRKNFFFSAQGKLCKLCALTHFPPNKANTFNLLIYFSVKKAIISILSTFVQVKGKSTSRSPWPQRKIAPPPREPSKSPSPLWEIYPSAPLKVEGGD
jgi:hypothetical protein